MAKLDTDKLVAEIAQGHHDLGRVFEAGQACIKNGPASLRWQLDVDRLGVDTPTPVGTVGDGELTLHECAIVERVTKLRWDQIRPITSAEMALAVIETVLHTRGGMDRSEAATVAEGLSQNAVLDAYSEVEVRPAAPT